MYTDLSLGLVWINMLAQSNLVHLPHKSQLYIGLKFDKLVTCPSWYS